MYTALFIHPTVNYMSVDREEAQGVDIVLNIELEFPYAKDSLDVCLSGQMFEHCPRLG